MCRCRTRENAAHDDDVTQTMRGDVEDDGATAMRRAGGPSRRDVHSASAQRQRRNTTLFTRATHKLQGCSGKGNGKKVNGV